MWVIIIELRRFSCWKRNIFSIKRSVIFNIQYSSFLQRNLDTVLFYQLSPGTIISSLKNSLSSIAVNLQNHRLIYYYKRKWLKCLPPFKLVSFLSISFVPPFLSLPLSGRFNSFPLINQDTRGYLFVRESFDGRQVRIAFPPSTFLILEMFSILKL